VTVSGMARLVISVGDAGDRQIIDVAWNRDRAARSRITRDGDAGAVRRAIILRLRRQNSGQQQQEKGEGFNPHIQSAREWQKRKKVNEIRLK
jgi:hypothetical protein